MNKKVGKLGYEICYSYHERLEDGSYDKETVKTMKRRLGKAEEEVTPDKLAGTIMAQLARRDIWVLDVEVYEFTKKKLSFKETKGGLVIGGKKYLLDECGHLAVQEVPEAVPQPVVHQQLPVSHSLHPFKPSFQSRVPQQMVEEMVKASGGTVNVADMHLLKKKPMRYEIFQPDPAFVDMVKARTLAFTVGEKYPIYAEKSAGSDHRLGMNYTTVDNNGQKQVLNDKHFVPTTSLIGGFDEESRQDIALDYGDTGGFGANMPKLR